MPKSINRKLAEVLVPSTTALKESVLDDISAGVTPYATLDDLPTSNLTLGDQAFVTSNQRLYLSNGSGWYNVAMFNATPNLTISPSGVITLATDGTTPTVITLTGTDSDNADANLIYSVESDGSFGGLGTLSQDSSVFTITPLAEGSATTTSSTLTFKVSDGINFGSGTTEFSLTFGISWGNEVFLRANDYGQDDRFGASVAISGDGTYIAVGANLWDGSPITNQGAIYMYSASSGYTDNTGSFVQRIQLSSGDGSGSGQFGYAVDLNNDGNIVAIGDPFAGAFYTNGGRIQIWGRSGGSTYSKLASLGFSTGMSNVSGVGKSVAVSGDGLWVAAGGPNHQSYGAVGIYEASGGTYVERQLLLHSATGDSVVYSPEFGASVALNSDGTTLAIGAPLSIGAANGAGCIYIFTRSGSTWSYQGKAFASDGAGIERLANQRKLSISNDGNTIAAGCSIAGRGGYIFTRSGSTWTQQAKLTTPPGATSQFGASISINGDGDKVIVGDWLNTTNQSGGGEATVYTKDGSSWSIDSTLFHPTTLTYGANYGYAVDISNTTNPIAVIGAQRYQLSNGSGIEYGQAFVYEAG